MFFEYFIFILLFRYIEAMNFGGLQQRRECPSGTFGHACDFKCRHPSFGEGCRQRCDCGKRLCNHVKGCPPLGDHCRNGYVGKYCETRCSFPKYGYGCQQICLCSKLSCHFATGCHIKHNEVRITNEELDVQIETISAKERQTPTVYILTTLEAQTRNTAPSRPQTKQISMRIRDEQQRTASRENVSEILNPKVLHFSDSAKDKPFQYQWRTTYFWNKLTWIRICLIFFCLVLLVLITLHCILSIVRFVKKDKEMAEEIDVKDEI